jgi:adenylate kinase
VTGKRRQEMLQGKLLSDEEMVTILDKIFELIDPTQEFILDGFPRTIPQADWLLEQVHNGRFSLTAVINLSASEDVVRERLMARGRLDDNDEAIAERFREYRAVTLPILNHFREEGVVVHDINAAQEPRVVHDEILKCIDE